MLVRRPRLLLLIATLLLPGILAASASASECCRIDGDFCVPLETVDCVNSGGNSFSLSFSCASVGPKSP